MLGRDHDLVADLYKTFSKDFSSQAAAITESPVKAVLFRQDGRPGTWLAKLDAFHLNQTNRKFVTDQGIEIDSSGQDVTTSFNRGEGLGHFLVCPVNRLNRNERDVPDSHPLALGEGAQAERVTIALQTDAGNCPRSHDRFHRQALLRTKVNGNDYSHCFTRI